jgi:hypothetical protein
MAFENNYTLEASSCFALEIFFRSPSSALSNENINGVETNTMRATTAKVSQSGRKTKTITPKATNIIPVATNIKTNVKCTKELVYQDKSRINKIERKPGTYHWSCGRWGHRSSDIANPDMPWLSVTYMWVPRLSGPSCQWLKCREWHVRGSSSVVRIPLHANSCCIRLLLRRLISSRWIMTVAYRKRPWCPRS